MSSTKRASAVVKRRSSARASGRPIQPPGGASIRPAFTSAAPSAGRRRRAVSAPDVADAVALVVERELAVAYLLRNPLGLLPRDQTVAPAGGRKQRLVDQGRRLAEPSRVPGRRNGAPGRRRPPRFARQPRSTTSSIDVPGSFSIPTAAWRPGPAETEAPGWVVEPVW